MFNEFGIDPAVIICFLGVAAFVIIGLAGATCALIGALIGKFLLWLIRGNIDRVRL